MEGLEKKTIAAVIDTALSTGGDFAEVYYEDTAHSNITASVHATEKSSFGKERGVGIRIFHGLASIYAYTNDLSYDNLLKTAKEAAGHIKSAEGKGAALSLGNLVDCAAHKIQKPFNTTGYKEKLALMKRAFAPGMAYSPDITQMEVMYLDMVQNIIVANSDGVYVSDNRTKTRFMVMAIAQNENGLQRGSSRQSAMEGMEFYDNMDIEGHAREAARVAVTMLNAEKCKGGQMPVVLDNGFAGLLFHEACGHSLEASSVARGTSEFSGKLGEQIASPLVTLVDEGNIPNRWGSLSIDDEGTPTKKNILIENGILKSYMIDKLNGRRMGMPSTGAGRRQNYRFAPTSRMTNTYVANGSSTRDQVIESTERGLFVQNITGGSVDPATGDFNFASAESYLIEDGKITKPVRGATLIGNGGEVLKRVDQIADNLKIVDGYCFAGSGALFITAGQPTLRVSKMTVGGIR